ncbi:hypothetical protein [Desulfofustis glycolicus]|uniref:Uncharacterized protein n=1 Tax=Desulfofustis glycolicus DSM 9705 TaxID=1121409 RepID=A0A1M5S6B4_9BACT|nr:hypothetical protein [Desulfofustis glycolicus]SHH33818.1 hypothetical protein SAMN02745124_00175 [Desulfofustis glycolicus DSM 9705]
MNIWGWVFIGLMAVAFLWAMIHGWRLDVHLPSVMFVIFCFVAAGYVVGLGARILKATLGW